MRPRTLTYSVLTFLFVAAPALAQTSFPMITHTTPTAVQRGKTAEVLVQGKMNFYGCYKVLVEGEGIQAELVGAKPDMKPPKPLPQVSQVKVKFTVAPDAPLGVRDFRVASTLGISSIGQLVVVDDPVIEEAKVNNTPTQAQAVNLPCVLTGRLEIKEDLDYFKFTAKEGDLLSFEMFCARLQDRIHDLQKHAKPMLVLFDEEGRELAANDHFFFADPLLTYKVTKSGTYYLQVRESTYDGDPRWAYAVLATNKPHASHVYPMAGNPGKMMQVTPVGSAQQFKAKVPLQVPTKLGVQQLQLDIDGVKTNPVTFLVSNLPQVLETEDNDTPDKANRVTIPCGINGQIGKNRDLDHFVFKGTKGKAILFEVKARRFGTILNSTVHAVLDVMNPKGDIVASNLDTHGLEASLLFTPPADGDYVLRVRDLNSKGSESAVYFVSADWARQDFEISCDPDKAMIGPGSSTVWFVQAKRQQGFAGPIKIDVKGLPEGVTCNALTIPATMTQGTLVLTATEKAKHAAANIDISGTATVKDETGKEIVLTRKATPAQEIYFPGGGRGLFDVTLQTVAITDPSDILKVKVSQNKIVLKPGQEVKIDVEVERSPEYTKGVSLDILLRHLNRVFGNALPPGVTIVEGKSKTLLGTGNKGHIVLKADASAAPIDEVPIAVMAHVSINFVVKLGYSSEPIWISIKK